MTIVKSKTKLKKTSAEKKRHGQHHRVSSHDYLKTYWPYLPMLLLIGVCLLLNNLLVSHPSVLGISSDLSSRSFLTDTNIQRTSDKETPLIINTQLTQAAQNKANDMVKENFWSHISPSGETPWQYITTAGYNYSQAGENLAYGFSNASQVISAWMNSPEHRQNILNSNYQEVGFATASSINYLGQGPETVVVAEYAQPSPSSAVANISFTVPPSSKVKGLNTVNTDAPNASLVSRIQVLTNGNASWSLVVASFITGVLVCYFIYRNYKAIKKLVKSGEKFAGSHIILDIIIVVAICFGFILTRTSGFIH